jgi:ABC-type oligopeptide transport system ATPase subunit
MISEKAEKGTTALVATHIIPEKLEKQVKTIIKMELGKIVEIKKIE